jgi:uncharacterized protein (UPF0147 family)
MSCPIESKTSSASSTAAPNLSIVVPSSEEERERVSEELERALRVALKQSGLVGVDDATVVSLASQIAEDPNMPRAVRSGCVDELVEAAAAATTQLSAAELEREADEVISAAVADLVKRAVLVMERDPREDDRVYTTFLRATFDPNPQVRRHALRDLCPCRIRQDLDKVWERIAEMTRDEDADVRYQAMHNLCDGSPAERETFVIRALEDLHDDPDPKLRRVVHRVLSNYRRTGKWNIL